MGQTYLEQETGTKMPPECNNEAEDPVLLEKTSCINGRVKYNFGFAAFAFYGRRAMVNKFSCHEIASKWFQKKGKPPHARLFSEPKCQQYVATWYLIYRWFIFLAWLSIIVCSIFEFGSYQPLYIWEKWPIYLTNWDLLLGCSQALLGALIVSKRWRSQKEAGFDSCNLKLRTIERVYWFLYVATSTIAVGVTISYWLTVYDPKVHQIDPLNIMLHVCNSILMLIDVCIVSIPIKLRSFWWCLSVVIFYLIFSVIYYFAGGLDKLGNHYIYKILDWKKPGRTLLICVGGLTFVVVVHCLMCLLGRIKDRIYVRINGTIGKTSSDMNIDTSMTKKIAEVV